MAGAATLTLWWQEPGCWRSDWAYGVMLGLTHQALWLWAFDSPPRLGNLTGVLSPAAEQLVKRN
ncbi:MAG: hypothetical protein V7646_1926 [Pseudonocardia sp.]